MKETLLDRLHKPVRALVGVSMFFGSQVIAPSQIHAQETPDSGHELVLNPEQLRHDEALEGIIIPDQIKIGESVEGRSIEAVRFGNGEIKLVLIGGLHTGDVRIDKSNAENNTVDLAKEMIDYFKNNPDEIPEQLTLIIIPVVNIDGYMRGSHDNARGVDLNRNWPTRNWQENAIHTQRRASGGPNPLSEPETASLDSFIQELQPGLVVVWHSQAGIVEGNDREESERLAQIYAQEAGYQYILKWPHYPITGQFMDAMEELGIDEIDVELSTHSGPDFNPNLKAVKAVITALISVSPK